MQGVTVNQFASGLFDVRMGLRLVVILVLSASAMAQRTWTVSRCLDYPADFRDLPPAVAAASPGDTILLVESVPCSSSSSWILNSVTIDKALTIAGVRSGGSGSGGSVPYSIYLLGRMTLRNIPAGSRLVLSNLDLVNPDPFVVGGLQPSGLDAHDCAGEIVLEDVSAAALGLRDFVFRFHRCADVVIHGSWINGSGEPVTFVDSNAVVSQTRVEMGNGVSSPIYYSYAAQNSRALLVRNSVVSITYSRLLAADGIWDYQNGRYIRMPQEGALVESGGLFLGPEAHIQGGFDPAPWYRWFWPGLAAGSPPEIVHVDSRASLSLGTGSGGGTPAEIHAVYNDSVIQGQQYDVTIAGPPGGFGLLAVGSSPLAPIPVGIGDLALDPFTIQFVAAASLPPGEGMVTIPLACSTLVPIGHVFAFQAAVLAPNGAISLTLPSPFAVAWAYGRIL
jgi:hypothetical protein